MDMSLIAYNKQKYIQIIAIILALASIILAILSFYINNLIDFKFASIIIASLNSSFLLKISNIDNKLRYLLILNLIFIIAMSIFTLIIR